MLPILLWTIACGTTEPPPSVPVDDPNQVGEARDRKGKGGGGGAGKGGGGGMEGTLVSLEGGDAACWVKLRDESGAEKTYAGAFELCPGGGSDSTAWVGKTVRAKIGRKEIAADSCQGNPACTEKQTVDFVEMMKGV